jgi:hypothetical protein
VRRLPLLPNARSACSKQRQAVIGRKTLSRIRVDHSLKTAAAAADTFGATVRNWAVVVLIRGKRAAEFVLPSIGAPAMA